jgi:hypothetical protein
MVFVEEPNTLPDVYAQHTCHSSINCIQSLYASSSAKD